MANYLSMTTSHEDQLLIERAKVQGESFGELYRKYSRRVYYYFWYRVGCRQDVAEDLMQETFIRAFRHLGRFEPRNAPYISFLLTVAHNLLVDYYRKPKTLSLELAEDIPIEIMGDLENASDAALLKQAIGELPQKEKDVVTMKYQDGLSVREIATVMKKSENAVRLILCRTRKKLAQHPFLVELAPLHHGIA